MIVRAGSIDHGALIDHDANANDKPANAKPTNGFVHIGRIES